MPLVRLTPQTHRYTLGTLRLWQDDLVEIVRLAQQLPDVIVDVESDDNRITADSDDDLLASVRTELPKLGPSVRYFKLIASRAPQSPPDLSQSPSDTSQAERLIEVNLSVGGCMIEAINPDLATMGLVESIKSFARSRRRPPGWANTLYRTRDGRPNWVTRTFALLLLACVGVVLALGATIPQEFSMHRTALGDSVFAGCILILVMGQIGIIQDRTLIFTATQREAPTLWQRKRADIVIAVVVALAFYILGLLTPR